MQSRRKFLKLTLAFWGSTFITTFNAKAKGILEPNKWFMPEESERHKRTWISFIASYDIWEERQVKEVQHNLASIAKTIAKYEPVSMLVRKKDYKYDAEVADFVAKKADVSSIQSSLVLEGGCFELDGQGTAIMTESCILNDNRNPNKGKAEVESELKELLGLEKIIWLKGIKGKDITDGHTDFYARFAKPGVIVVSKDMDQASYDYKVTRENIEVLKSAVDAEGNAFDIITLDTPWDINTRFGTKDFAAGYVGYYVCNGAVIMQKFGDENADNAEKQKLTKVFPKHRIEQIAIDGIASGGGSIHCATQQEPEV